MERERMLKEQAQLLRDIAHATEHPEVRKRLHRLARECEELLTVLARAANSRAVNPGE